MSAHKTVVLRSATIQAKNFDEGEEVDVKTISGEVSSVSGKNGAYLVFKNLDLTDINGMKIKLNAKTIYKEGGILDFKLNQVNGRPFAKLKLENTAQSEPIQITTKSVKGKYDLYVVFKAADKTDTKPVMDLVSLQMMR